LVPAQRSRSFRQPPKPSARYVDNAGAAASFGQQLTVNAIVDANAVYRVLFWRLNTRQKPDARTTLEEALDSGVLVLIAPHFLKIEIDEKFSIIAAQTGSTLLEVRRGWEQLQQKLRFYRPLGRAAVTEAADPDDLPYKFASDELGLPIYTRDTHLKQMGAVHHTRVH
jgi:hypothetical protein